MQEVFLLEKYRYTDEELKLLENSPIPFAVYQFIDNRVVTIVLSEGFIDMLGYKGADKKDLYDLMDNNMHRDTHPDDLAIVADAAYRFATEGGNYDVLYRTKRNDEYRIIHSYGRHIYKEDGTRLAFVWYTDLGPFVDDGKKEDYSILNSFKDKLAERSFNNRIGHDYLTGLPSMTYFFDLADAGCSKIRDSGKIPVILFTDFDGMKVYNQRYGLEEGDKILKSFSEEIVGLFSHENCSRFSADHFCIFTDEETAREATDKLIESHSKDIAEKRMLLRIGMYLYEDPNISISGACDRAKMACDSGRKNYVSKLYLFDQKMMTSIEDRQYLIENIDRAVDEGWIKVFYQAVVRTANGKVCHEEALARWIDPDKGFLSPAVFIPALEESNTIYKLDLYVLDCVLEKMKDQAEKGIYVVPNSVNLSRSDFYTCDVVEEVRKRVDKAGIERDKIVIEITESAVADDVDYMIEQIKRFNELGFSVWMDDYGSGYSSPMVLQKVPFDLIKIDMLFVRQLEESEKAKIVLTEIVRMAMSLGLDTVVEGVETGEQAEFLKDIGCTMLQGYYFSKPTPYEELLEKIKDGMRIGFENPAESDYYALLGKVNLYNLSLSSRDGEQHTDYFDTWPMLMVECKDDKIKLVRANITFKNYIKESFPELVGKTELDMVPFIEKTDMRTANAVKMCAEDGKRAIIDDILPSGKSVKVLVWRIAVNPVTKDAAIMVAVLSSTEEQDEKFNKISGEYEKLQRENERLKEEADSNKKIMKLRKSVSDLLTNMPAMTFSKDVDTGKYLACNQAFADYANKETPEGVVGLTDLEIFDEQTAHHFVEDDKKALAMEGPYIFYEDVPDAAGNPRQFQTTKLKFTDDTGRECLLGLCQDVTDAMRIKREYTEKLAMVQNMAEIDALTGIKNKNAYKEREKLMNTRIQENRQPEFAIVILDVNDLKKINDAEGHEAGDRYICAACDIICQTFKRSPVYRTGGDEFVVISQDEDYARSAELVDVIARHNEDALINGGPVIACGMARHGKESTVAEVFEVADKKMYENKKSLKERQNS